MATLPVILERVTRVTPFGAQFWDMAAGKAVGNGLAVTAYPPNNPELRTSATPNRASVYVLHDLRGLREVEHGTGDAEFWANLSPKPFIVEVVDEEYRYQPFRFDAQLPVRGLFTLGCLPVASPPDSLPAIVPLYPAPTYTPPSGMAVLRAHLRHVSDKPAAWAALEVYWKNQFLGRSFANKEGRITIVFPYPKPADPEFASPPASPLSSPPFSSRRALWEQTWPLQLRARYTPIPNPPDLPDLCEVFSQAPATLFAGLSPATPLPDVPLAFGQELVIRSGSQSEVWVA